MVFQRSVFGGVNWDERFCGVGRVDVPARRTGALSPELGLELFGRLEPLFASAEVSVFVRSDSWFLFEPSYPFYNPFFERTSPPTLQEYERTKTLSAATGQAQGLAGFGNRI